jgi:hypothetical protein
MTDIVQTQDLSTVQIGGLYEELLSAWNAAVDVALMHAEGGTILPGHERVDPERNSIQTMVATRRAGHWRLAAFRNTRTVYFGRPELLDQLTAELNALT